VAAMLIRDGLRPQLWNLFPKRDFRLLIDPNCLSLFSSPEQSAILQFIVDLNALNPPIHVQLLTPEKPHTEEPLFEVLTECISSDMYLPVRFDVDDPRRRLLEDEPSTKHDRALCALAIREKVDGVVTASAVLLAARYALTQDLINIIAIDELADFVEVCAHGHNVFWSVAHSSALNQDVYYVLAHHKGKRLSNWWSALSKESITVESQEQLRSLILNRYPFILFARDMVRFYRLQRDDSRRNEDPYYSFGLTYHLNQFYILLWGTLDQLSLLANLIFDLGLDPFDCGIRRPKFVRALEIQISALYTFLKMPVVHDWISLMSDFRHAAAHQVIPMPTEIVIDTEDSKKPKDEILKILREEDPDFEMYRQSSLNPEGKAWFEDFAVSQWRDSKRERLADHMVYLKNKQGHYFRSPVVSLDHDLAMLTGIMDAFLVRMFQKRKTTLSST
jgi:hypothetical protein